MNYLLNRAVTAALVTASLSACASEPPRLVTQVVKEPVPVKKVEREPLNLDEIKIASNEVNKLGKAVNQIHVKRSVESKELLKPIDTIAKTEPLKFPVVKPLSKHLGNKEDVKVVKLKTLDKYKLGGMNSDEINLDKVDKSLFEQDLSDVKLIVKKKPKPLLMVHHNENTLDAISRWIRADGVENISWSLPTEVMNKLNSRSVGDVVLKDSISGSVAALSTELKTPIKVSYSVTGKEKIAAVVPWLGESRITLVDQPSLKLAVKQLANAYGWNFIDDNQRGKSYRAVTDYPFPSAYPIATPKHDFEMAIDLLIKHYPVRVELFDGTQTVYVMDEK